MTELTLPGCRTTPLGSYLAALGLLRAVTRLLDSEVTGRWERQRFVLTSQRDTLDGLVDELLARFEPESIVSPWNAGSGFAGNGKNVTAERALQTVRQSDDPRLTCLREAVAAGDRVVVVGRERGWGGKGDDLWDKARKRDVLGLCRNEFPDHALPWLDAAVALGQDDDPAYSRLLGTGGNFGRQDLSATYLARVQSILTDRRSRGWLHSLLSGEDSTPYLRDAVGQFDPGRAGGIQSASCGPRSGPPWPGWRRSRICSPKAGPNGTTVRPALGSTSPGRSPLLELTAASTLSSGTCSSTGTARIHLPCPLGGSR